MPRSSSVTIVSLSSPECTFTAAIGYQRQCHAWIPTSIHQTLIQCFASQNPHPKCYCEMWRVAMGISVVLRKSRVTSEMAGHLVARGDQLSAELGSLFGEESGMNRKGTAAASRKHAKTPLKQRCRVLLKSTYLPRLPWNGPYGPACHAAPPHPLSRCRQLVSFVDDDVPATPRFRATTSSSTASAPARATITILQLDWQHLTRSFDTFQCDCWAFTSDRLRRHTRPFPQVCPSFLTHDLLP